MSTSKTPAMVLNRHPGTEGLTASYTLVAKFMVETPIEQLSALLRSRARTMDILAVLAALLISVHVGLIPVFGTPSMACAADDTRYLDSRILASTDEPQTWDNEFISELQHDLNILLLMGLDFTYLKARTRRGIGEMFARVALLLGVFFLFIGLIIHTIATLPRPYWIAFGVLSYLSLFFVSGGGNEMKDSIDRANALQKERRKVHIVKAKRLEKLRKEMSDAIERAENSASEEEEEKTTKIERWGDMITSLSNKPIRSWFTGVRRPSSSV
ncbi:hypothetical protein MKEN_00187600 [Mycena kentingensis (nom. inval.)]|nr:hypothetical protein MKEN_00187600 [Mycena kentingensis (nom. inval.)]